jgi:hypothetical protein
MKLNHTFLAKVVETTTYVQNQIPTKAISSITLKEVCCEYKLSISHLCVFGCIAFARVSKQARTKLVFKGVKCYPLAIVKSLRGTNFTTLQANMLSSIMMLSLMNLETLIRKQWFEGWIHNIWL